MNRGALSRSLTRPYPESTPYDFGLNHSHPRLYGGVTFAYGNGRIQHNGVTRAN